MGELFSLKGKINNEFLTNIPVNLVNLFHINQLYPKSPNSPSLFHIPTYPFPA